MKKYSSGSFIDAAVRVYGSEADTISSFPATVYADGENAAALIKGNLQQSGTPTAAAPITPTECGDLSSAKYVIPFQSGNTTTNIDLSAVTTTRATAPALTAYVLTISILQSQQAIQT